MHKIVKIVLIVIGFICTVLFFRLPSMDTPLAEAVESGAMGLMFNIAYLLLAISILVTLVYGFMNLLSSGGLKKTLLLVGGFLVIVAVSYALSKGTDVNLEELAQNGAYASESLVKWIGAGLYIFFILMIIAVGALLAGGVKKMIN
jgi:uncharacterized membrane protein